MDGSMLRCAVAGATPLLKCALRRKKPVSTLLLVLAAVAAISHGRPAQSACKHPCPVHERVSLPGPAFQKAAAASVYRRTLVVEGRGGEFGNDGTAGDGFGARIAAQPDGVLVAAPADYYARSVEPGSLYYFARNGVAWGLAAKIVPPAGTTDFRAETAAMHGNLVAVAMQGGRIMLFERSAQAWEFSSTITTPGQTYVRSLELRGDRLLALVGGGSAYVFRRDGTNWMTEWTFEQPFGAVVDIESTSITLQNDFAIFASGAGTLASVRSGTSWSQPVRLDTLGGPSPYPVALSVASSQDTVVMAGTRDDQFGVMLFRHAQGTWRIDGSYALDAIDPAPSIQLVAAIESDLAAVTVRAASNPLGQRSVRTFRRTESGWLRGPSLTLPQGTARGSQFGIAIAIANAEILVGEIAPAPGIDRNSFGVMQYRLEGQNLVHSGSLNAGFAGPDVVGQHVDIAPNRAIATTGCTSFVPGRCVAELLIFEHGPSGWVLSDRLAPTPDQTNDQPQGFQSVRLLGDTVFASLQGSNRVLVYRKRGAKWVLEQQLQSPAGQPWSRFGDGIEATNDLLVVAAPSETVAGAQGSGVVYAYRRSPADVWVLEGVVANPAPAGGEFGSALAVDGTRLVVGNTWVPRCDVFGRDASGWVHEASIDVPSAVEHCLGVAVSGDLLAIGAPYPLSSSNQLAAVFVYQRTSTTWQLASTLTASPAGLPGRYSGFGRRLRFANDRLIVGAPHQTTSDGQIAGAIFEYQRNGTAWTSGAHIMSPEPQQWGNFGDMFAVSASLIVAGVPVYGGTAIHNNRFEGAMWMFDGDDVILADGFEP